ncbi:MAG: hypothetical protein GY913_06415 [Proteobacteria bacterium]|nr:hypothetical protein [Pseudomonadota bacterium]
MAFHLTSRLADSSVLAPELHAVRRLARVVLDIGDGYGLVLFAIAGDHLHFVLACGRKEPGVFARAVEAAITIVLGRWPGFRPVDITPVRGREHLAVLTPYVLGQAARHGIVGDPLLESTNALDLLSVRQVGTGCASRLRAHLPHMTRDELTGLFGGEPALGTDPGRLIEAAGVVTCGLPFHSRAPVAGRARGSAVRLAQARGVGFNATRELLGLSNSTVARGRRRIDPAMDRSLELALGLVQSHAPAGFPSRVTMPDEVTFRRRPPRELVRPR